MKNFLINLYNNAVTLNFTNIQSLLEKNSNAFFLDLGCDNGNIGKLLAQKIGTLNIYGIDIVKNRIDEAKKNGLKVIKSDLNYKLPFKDNSFDVIHANQVIEHIAFLDIFVFEIHRVLKKGGYAIVSTENGSSWANIFASLMGWQIFSLTNVSCQKIGIGNPLAIHRGTQVELSSWTHKTIFNYRGLKEFFEIYDFRIEKIMGAGYLPLFSKIGKFDPRHANFLTLKVKKL